MKRLSRAAPGTLIAIGMVLSAAGALWGPLEYLVLSSLVLVLYTVAELGKVRTRGVGTAIANIGAAVAAVALAPVAASLVAFLATWVAPNNRAIFAYVEDPLYLFGALGIPAFGVAAVAMIVGSILSLRDRR